MAAAATAENAHDMHSMHQSAQTAHEKEYVESMGDMHKDMMEGIKDADADRAFARSMIPHHAGAIKMAEIELKYGKDPEMRKLAEQTRHFQNWLERTEGEATVFRGVCQIVEAQCNANALLYHQRGVENKVIGCDDI